MILKYRFLSQLAPDICRKLLKQVYGPNQSLNNLLQLDQSIMVENMRKRKTKEQAEAIVMAVRSSWKQPEKNAQRDLDEKGWACYYCGKEGTSSGIALGHLSCPWLHIQFGRDHTRRKTAPRGVGFRGRTLKTIRTEGVWGSVHKLPS